MAWIESHQSIENHPKTHALMGLMGWTEVDFAISKLHRLWWWALDYAADGDLRKYNDSVIGGRVGLYGADATKFVKALVEARWLDRKPYFRIHDWWDYVGKFLQIKYKHDPQRWQIVRDAYNGSNNPPKNPPKTRNQPTLDQPTNQPSKSHSANAASKARKRPVRVPTAQQAMVQALADVYSNGVIGKRGSAYGASAAAIIELGGQSHQVRPKFETLLRERGGIASKATHRVLAEQWSVLAEADILSPDTFVITPEQDAEMRRMAQESGA